MTDTKKNTKTVDNETEKQRKPQEPADEASRASVDGAEVNYQEEAKQYKNLYLRALADYQNQTERMRQERSRMREIMQEQFVMQLVPVLDQLDMAEVFTKDPGLQMIAGLLRSTLSDMGLKAIDLAGKEFDPHYAEVIEVIEKKPENIIIEVTQKGYAMNGHIVRPGKVKVGGKVRT